MSDIYILFFRETDIWEKEIKTIVKKKDLIYLLCEMEKRELGSAFFIKGRKIRHIFYHNDTAPEILSVIKEQYEKESFKPEETRIILLSSQKKYFQKIKLEFMGSVAAVGYQTGPDAKCQIREREIMMADLVIEEPEIKPVEKEKKVVEKKEPERQEVLPYCKDLAEAKAGVCYHLSQRIRKHIRKETGTDLAGRELFDFIELIIKCNDRVEFGSSWGTVSNKPVHFQEEKFFGLKKEAEYYLAVADLFYKADVF